MAYKINWLVPDRLIDVMYPAVCDDNFLRQYDLDVIAMLDIGTPPVHVLIDVRDVKSYPSTQAIFQLRYNKHPHMGRLITIGALSNPINRFLVSLAIRALSLNMKDFYTREEAAAYIKSMENIVIDA